MSVTRIYTNVCFEMNVFSQSFINEICPWRTLISKKKSQIYNLTTFLLMPQIYTNSLKEVLLMLYYIDKTWYHFIKEYLECSKFAFQKVEHPIKQPNRHTLEIKLPADTFWSSKTIGWVLGYTTVIGIISSVNQLLDAEKASVKFKSAATEHGITNVDFLKTPYYFDFVQMKALFGIKKQCNYTEELACVNNGRSSTNVGCSAHAGWWWFIKRNG